MSNRLLHRALLGVLLVATAALGGCYVAPYPYYPRYARGYGPGPVVVAPGPGYYRPYYRW